MTWAIAPYVFGPCEAVCLGGALMLQAGTLRGQSTASAVYDRVILGGHVMDPASGLDAVRNVGLQDGRIAVIKIGRASCRERV